MGSPSGAMVRGGLATPHLVEADGGACGSVRRGAVRLRGLSEAGAVAQAVPLGAGLWRDGILVLKLRACPCCLLVWWALCSRAAVHALGARLVSSEGFLSLGL